MLWDAGGPLAEKAACAPGRSDAKLRPTRRYRTYQDDRNLFMLMEYVQGGELGRHLRNEGTFANETARFYAAQVGRRASAAAGRPDVRLAQDSELGEWEP